jgi:hypothetical protein
MGLGRLLGPLAKAAELELTGAIGVGSSRDDYRLPCTVDWLALAGDRYEPTARSGLVEFGRAARRTAGLASPASNLKPAV